MRSYDDIIDYDYTNYEEWVEFLKQNLLPLNNAILRLLNLREYLVNILNEEFPNLIQSNQKIKEILLGGTNKLGDYESNSIAYLYKETLGLYLNLSEWNIYSSRSDIDATDYIKCEYYNPEFLQFIKDMNLLINELLTLIDYHIPETDSEVIKDIIETPEKIIEDLITIYSYIVKISPHINYHTLLILNTRLVPKFFLEKAYPRLRKDFEKLKKCLGLIIKDIFNQNIEFCFHEENGYADLMHKLIELIWEYFDKDIFNYELTKYENVLKSSLGKICEIPNLKNDYCNIAFPFLERLLISKNIFIKEELESVEPHIFDCKSCIDEFNIERRWTNRKIYDICIYISSGVVDHLKHQVRYIRSWNNTNGNIQRSHSDENMPLLNLISNLSPLMFLGIYKVQLDENYILIEV